MTRIKIKTRTPQGVLDIALTSEAGSSIIIHRATTIGATSSSKGGRIESSERNPSTTFLKTSRTDFINNIWTTSTQLMPRTLEIPTSPKIHAITVLRNR